MVIPRTPRGIGPAKNLHDRYITFTHIPHHPQPPPWSPAFRQVPSRPQPSPAIPSQVAASPSFCPQNEEKWLTEPCGEKKFAACTFQHVVFFEIYTAGLAARHTRRWRPHALTCASFGPFRSIPPSTCASSGPPPESVDTGAFPLFSGEARDLTLQPSRGVLHVRAPPSMLKVRSGRKIFGVKT